MAASPRSLSFVSRFGKIGLEREIVAEAWDVAGLAHRYTAFIREFRSVRARDDADAFAAQTRLVHEWRRFAFHDPVLPAELLPADWVGVRAKAFYDEKITQWRAAATRWYRDSEKDAAAG